MKKLLKSAKGFTLIELLIVIAVLGVLAATVLVAIDPVEQLARGRDAGRKSSISQVGNALSAYYTANGAVLPVLNWSTALVTSGDIKIFPSDTVTAAHPTCTNNATAGGWCYRITAPSDFVVYTHLESKTERNKTNGTSCGGAGANNAWYVYSSLDGRAGTVCSAAEPTVAAQTFTAQ